MAYEIPGGFAVEAVHGDTHGIMRFTFRPDVLDGMLARLGVVDPAQLSADALRAMCSWTHDFNDRLPEQAGEHPTDVAVILDEAAGSAVYGADTGPMVAAFVSDLFSGNPDRYDPTLRPVGVEIRIFDLDSPSGLEANTPQALFSTVIGPEPTSN